MIKKIMVVLLTIFALLLFLGCKQKPEQPPVVQEPKVVEVPAEDLPTTGEQSVDEVGTEISDTSDVDEDLDASELDDLENVLSDIENI